jgi:class 3 adenylate cyclase
VSKGLSGCGACGGTAFVCEQGHDINSAAWKDGLTFHPARRLLTWISAGLDELRLRPGFNSASESIRIRGRELLYSSRRPLPAGEYSVLQADVRHSTVMRTKEPERYRDLQGRVRDGLDGAARTRRGDMASWGGDGGFWLFHTPEEAMQSAVELQRELATHGFDRNVVRVAIARGPITLQQGEYDGDVMHLASRLQKHATSGARIVVDTPTALKLSHHLDLDDGHPVSALDPAYAGRRGMFFKVRAVRDSLFGRSEASR